MSKTFSNTTADFLTWEQNLNLIRKLYDDGNYKFSLLISLGSFWGLRISDLLKLKWNDILNKDELIVIEQKTGKKRDIKINPQLQKHVNACYNKLQPSSENDFIFISQKNTVYSIQRINVIFKDIKKKYKLKISNFSTHSMRKTFGRQVFNSAGTNAELALAMLAEIFNHSSVATTRRYLGIHKEELLKVCEYILDNPVKKGLAEEQGGWPYSGMPDLLPR